jgi:hypothetical protein
LQTRSGKPSDPYLYFLDQIWQSFRPLSIFLDQAWRRFRSLPLFQTKCAADPKFIFAPDLAVLQIPVFIFVPDL